MRVKLLLGAEAAAQGAIDAGIAGAFSYPVHPRPRSSSISRVAREAPGRSRRCGPRTKRWPTRKPCG